MSRKIYFSIDDLLEKMTSSDKDFRFMATNDLMSELQGRVKFDDDVEDKVVQALLKLLEDNNGEVLNLAVKCKLSECRVMIIIDSLCSNMVSDKEQLRYISCIGLKNVIGEVPLTLYYLAANVCKRRTGKLSSAIEKQKAQSVQLLALDVLSDLLSQMGNTLVSFHQTILTALLPQLASPRQAVRKWTIVALSHLVKSCNQHLYSEIIDFLLEGLTQNKSPSTTQAYIQCIVAICRQTGHRFGEHLDRAMEFIVYFNEEAELKECRLQACEAFVQKCPKEITIHVDSVLAFCLEHLTCDNNDTFEGMEDSMELDEEEEEDKDDDDYSDGDDLSWKVRRASAKCLEAIIATRPEYLPELYSIVSPALVSRFKERDENVKNEIFLAYITLLKQTRSFMGFSTDPNGMEDEDSPLCLLQKQVPSLVKAILGQTKERSIKTRHYCYSLLKELLTVMSGALCNHISALIPEIEHALSDRNSTSSLILDTLSFLNCLLTTHPPDVFHIHMNVLVPRVVSAVSDTFYKISAEALLVLQQLVKCTLVLLRATDIDQEVKERAISCMGQIICCLGDYLQSEIPTCFPTIRNLLRNDSSRLTMVNASTKVAASPFSIDLRPIFVKLELIPFISESDLNITQSTMVLLNSIAKLLPQVFRNIASSFILPKTITLAKSPLLQEAALVSLLDLLRTLARANLPGLSTKKLLEMLTSDVTQNLPPLQKQVLHEFCRHSIHWLNVSLPSLPWPNEVLSVVNKFVCDLVNPSSDQQHRFALLAIAEIGKHIDLSGFENLKDVIFDSFSSDSLNINSATSYALGRITVGNLDYFLPLILKEIETQPKTQYLLLQSLKEMISSQSSSEQVHQLINFVPSIWEFLFRHCECGEEGTRNLVSECLGKISLIYPALLLPLLQQALDSSSPLMRTTVVTALKFTLSDQPQSNDPLSRSTIEHILKALEDPDLNVRRVALVAFNSAARNKLYLLRDVLDSVLPNICAETNVRKELIRNVELGPFKHVDDEGLGIRQAAFECMYTVLNACLDRLDIFEFLSHLEHGLRDHYDIKRLTYVMVSMLARLVPSAVLQRLEGLVEPLKDVCTMEVRAYSLKSEIEKQDVLKRSAMRVVAALLTIPDAGKNPKFVKQIKSTSELLAIFDSINKDPSLLNQDSNMMDLS